MAFDHCFTLTLRSAEGISERLDVTRVSSKSRTRVFILFSSGGRSCIATGRVRGSAPSMNSDNAPLFFTLLGNIQKIRNDNHFLFK